MDELPDTVRQKTIQIGIVAVPAAQAGDVVDRITSCGIRAILNYAPVNPLVPPEVKVRNIDPVLSLQSMTYYLRSGDNGSKT
jgi:redox-sensing transcriptional repressor